MAVRIDHTPTDILITYPSRTRSVTDRVCSLHGQMDTVPRFSVEPISNLPATRPRLQVGKNRKKQADHSPRSNNDQTTDSHHAPTQNRPLAAAVRDTTDLSEQCPPPGRRFPFLRIGWWGANRRRQLPGCQTVKRQHAPLAGPARRRRRKGVAAAAQTQDSSPSSPSSLSKKKLLPSDRSLLPSFPAAVVETEVTRQRSNSGADFVLRGVSVLTSPAWSSEDDIDHPKYNQFRRNRFHPGQEGQREAAASSAVTPMKTELDGVEPQRPKKGPCLSSTEGAAAKEQKPPRGKRSAPSRNRYRDTLTSAKAIPPPALDAPRTFTEVTPKGVQPPKVCPCRSHPDRNTPPNAAHLPSTATANKSPQLWHWFLSKLRKEAPQGLESGVRTTASSRKSTNRRRNEGTSYSFKDNPSSRTSLMQLKSVRTSKSCPYPVEPTTPAPATRTRQLPVAPQPAKQPSVRPVEDTPEQSATVPVLTAVTMPPVSGVFRANSWSRPQSSDGAAASVARETVEADHFELLWDFSFLNCGDALDVLRASPPHSSLEPSNSPYVTPRDDPQPFQNGHCPALLTQPMPDGELDMVDSVSLIFSGEQAGNHSGEGCPTRHYRQPSSGLGNGSCMTGNPVLYCGGDIHTPLDSPDMGQPPHDWPPPQHCDLPSSTIHSECNSRDCSFHGFNEFLPSQSIPRAHSSSSIYFSITSPFTSFPYGEPVTARVATTVFRQQPTYLTHRGTALS